MKTDKFIIYISVILIKMLNFDKKDKKILYELDKNSRQPLSKIAKKVGLSRESVLYRLKKYEKEQIIKSYLTVIDIAKLGFTHHKICVKLHNITQKQEEALIQDLVKNPFISWVSSCDGKYSLLYAIKTKSIVELDKILKEINNKYWRFIKEQDVSTLIEGHHFYREYLIEKRGTTEREIIWGGEPKKLNLDKKSITILDELAKNARTSAVDIAKKLKSSPDMVIKRIKQLEKSGVLTHYMIWPDVNKLKGNYYKALITLVNLNPVKEKQLAEFCLDNPNIVYFVKILAPWQFEMDIEIDSVKEFRELMREFLNQFSDIISDYSALNIYQEHKFRFFEKEILQ